VRTLTVSGHGTASAIPDSALIRVSAVHRARFLVDALSGAESARAEVLKAAGDLVVSTVNLTAWPSHEQGQQAGFEARHTLTIAAGDVATASDVLSRLAQGVGLYLQVEGIELSVRDPSAAVAKAREGAFADARTSAQHLAALTGATLGQVEAVVEAASVPTSAGVAAMTKVVDVGLQPGEATISASLTVTWSLT
jgi:uncharacterized protein YggE